MGNHPSDISVAEDAALELKLLIRRAAADGVINERELRAIRRESEIVHQKTRQAHHSQRKAISILRTGRVSVGVVREFGTDDEPAVA